MDVIKWAEIEAFHNVRKSVLAFPELLGDHSTVTYRGKVKLHGTNAAIQITKDGIVAAQSRTTILTPTSDNAGFAKWVEQHKEALSARKFSLADNEQTLVIFGEWCGPGIQKGVAINQIPNKVFAVFAVQVIEQNGSKNTLIVEPKDLQDIVCNVSPKIPDVYVLPWHTDNVRVHWQASAESLQASIDSCNAAVAEVEKCDPWVKDTFGKEGLGEGIVYYPISHPGTKAFEDLAFKAKGEKHKVVASKNAVQVNAEKVEGVDEFAALVLTEARLEQGARAISDNGELVFDVKKVGKFIGWIAKDVEKETSAELEASGLTWKQVMRTIESKSRTWYLDKTKML